MNLLIQLFIIFAFSFAGDVIAATLKLPIPGSIVGLFLLFFALQLKRIHVRDIDDAGSWLKNNMAFLFVPATVGIMPYFDLIRNSWLNLTLVVILSTLITYIVTAMIAQYINRKER